MAKTPNRDKIKEDQQSRNPRMTQFDACVIGHSCIDIVAKGMHGRPQFDKARLCAPSCVNFPGGCAVRTAIGLAKLNSQVDLVTLISALDWGRVLCKMIWEQKVHFDAFSLSIEDDRIANGVTFAQETANQSPLFAHCLNVNSLLDLSWVKQRIQSIQQAEVIVFAGLGVIDGICNKAFSEWFGGVLASRSKERPLVIADTNILAPSPDRPLSHFGHIIAHCDIIIPNDLELMYISEIKGTEFDPIFTDPKTITPADLGHAALAMFAKFSKLQCIVVKRGGMAALVFCRSKWKLSTKHSPTTSAEIVSVERAGYCYVDALKHPHIKFHCSLGAGDAWNAGFIKYMIWAIDRGKLKPEAISQELLVQAVKHGHVNAAHAFNSQGDCRVLPDWSTIQKQTKAFVDEYHVLDVGEDIELPLLVGVERS